MPLARCLLSLGLLALAVAAPTDAPTPAPSLAPTEEDEGALEGLWFVGILLTMMGSLVGSVGKLLMKFAHNGRKSRGPIFFWVVYIVAMICIVALNPVCDVGAYAFASQSLIVPFSSTSIVWAALFAPCMLGEKLTMYDAVGISVIVIGCIIVGVAGNKDSQDIKWSDISRNFNKNSFFIYIVVVIAVLIVMCCVMYWTATYDHVGVRALRKKHRDRRIGPARVAMENKEHIMAAKLKALKAAEEAEKRAAEKKEAKRAAKLAAKLARAGNNPSLGTNSTSGSKTEDGVVSSPSPSPSTDGADMATKDIELAEMNAPSVDEERPSSPSEPLPATVLHSAQHQDNDDDDETFTANTAFQGYVAAMREAEKQRLAQEAEAEAALKVKADKWAGNFFRRFCFGAAGGILGGNQFIIKAFTTIFGLGFDPPGQSVAIMVGAGVVAGGGLFLLNQGMIHYPAVEVITLYQSFLIIVGSASAAAFWGDWDNFTTWQYIVFPIGLLVTIVGIIILVSKPQSPPPPSEDFTQIHFTMPAGWERLYDENGRAFYANRKLGVTQWQVPVQAEQVVVVPNPAINSSSDEAAATPIIVSVRPEEMPHGPEQDQAVIDAMGHDQTDNSPPVRTSAAIF